MTKIVFITDVTQTFNKWISSQCRPGQLAGHPALPSGVPSSIPSPAVLAVTGKTSKQL